MTTADSLHHFDAHAGDIRQPGPIRLVAPKLGIRRLSGGNTGVLDRPRPVQVTEGARTWSAAYRWILRATDASVVLAAVFGGTALWAQATGAALGERYLLACVAFSALWLCVLGMSDTRSGRVTGVGMAEFKRVWDASLAVLAAIAVTTVIVEGPYTRGALAVGVPLGIAGLLVERAVWREWLKARRRGGHAAWSTQVLLVGSDESRDRIREELERVPSAGFRVVGECAPSDDAGACVADVNRALADTGADTVIVTGSDDLPADKVKQISWSLEAGRQHLLLAPNITDIAGPRVRTRPAAGVPLIHVETPRLGRGQRILKRTFDVVASSVLILVFSPVLLALAAIVKITSSGPVLFRQARIGHHGNTFHMLKFRSMRQGADAELAALLAKQGTSEQPLFKVQNDPRITPVGRILRKYSLDELPQLFNVLGGSMSLVGPRPQVAAEVALYTSSARRRLLARPGITGLWQVSGRSTLDWDQSVRLDLYYVENWSLFVDIGILLRTFKAVVAPGETAH